MKKGNKKEESVRMSERGEDRWLLSPHPFVVRGHDSASTSHIENCPEATDSVAENSCTCARFWCVYFHTNKTSSGRLATCNPLWTAELAGLLAAAMWSDFQSVPPQRKKDHSQQPFSISLLLLLPTSPLPAIAVLQGIPSEASLFIRLTASKFELHLCFEMGCVGAGFRWRESSSLRTEWRLFSGAAGVDLDREELDQHLRTRQTAQTAVVLKDKTADETKRPLWTW